MSPEIAASWVNKEHPYNAIMLEPSIPGLHYVTVLKLEVGFFDHCRYLEAFLMATKGEQVDSGSHCLPHCLYNGTGVCDFYTSSLSVDRWMIV